MPAAPIAISASFGSVNFAAASAMRERGLLLLPSSAGAWVGAMSVGANAEAPAPPRSRETARRGGDWCDADAVDDDDQEEAAERHLRRPRAQTHAISGGRSSCEMTPRGSRFEVNGSGPLPFRI